jgi:hypothetical protein
MKHILRAGLLQTGVLGCLATPLHGQIDNIHTAASPIRAIDISWQNLCVTTSTGKTHIDLARAPASGPATTTGSSTLTGSAEPITFLGNSAGRFYGGSTSGNIYKYEPLYSLAASQGTGTAAGWVMPQDSPFTFSAGDVAYCLAPVTDEFLQPAAVYLKRGTGAPVLFWNNVGAIRDIAALNASSGGFTDLMVLDQYSPLGMKRVRLTPQLGPPPDYNLTYAVVATNIASNVQSMDSRDGRVYYAERDAADNTIVRLKSAVASGILGAMTVTTYSPARDLGSPVLFDELTVTPDGRFAFVQESVGGVRNLLRKDLTNNSVFQLMATASPATDGFWQLTSTNSHVYFQRSGLVVGRVATAAPVLTRDLAAGGLEVVQAIQNASNACPLVEGKITHARFFARIASSSAGETSLTLPILLHGTSGGLPLPGSPLTPRSGPGAVTNAAIDRYQDSANCWTFLLPDSWTRGNVTLTASVNGTRATSETSFSNNSSSASVFFQDTGTTEVRFLATKTVHGTVNRTLPEHQRALDHLTALFPASRMNYTWRGGEMSRPLVPFYCDGNGRFEVSAAFDDGWLLLLTQLFHNVMDLAGPRVHYVSLLPDFEGAAGWTGLASVGIYDLGLVNPTSAWFVILNDNELGHPRMSGTAAQEIAHNFGRGHVNCGSPDGVDSGYPYPTDSLSSPAAGYIAMDPLRHTLIQPAFAKDYMSYCAPKWTSDYTWRALLNRMPSLAPPVEIDGPTSGFLVGGHVDHHGKAYFLPIAPLNEAGSRAVAARLTAGPSHFDWELRFSMNNIVTQSHAVKPFELPADAGASEGTTFIAQLDLPPGSFDAVSLVDKTDGSTMGQVSAGANAPMVSLAFPVGGETFGPGAAPIIQWNASDPDGDAVHTTVRWSNDSGVSWRTLILSTSGGSLPTAGMILPGSGKPTCRIEFIVSDGLHSTTLQTGDFSYANHPAEVIIQPSTVRGTSAPGVAVVSALAGETITLRGIATDVEDLNPPTVSWNLVRPNGGNLAAFGEYLPIAALEPGQYLAEASVSDSVGSGSSADIIINVHRRFIPNAGSALVLDGSSEEPAWADDVRPTLVFAGSSVIPVRFVHRDGALWISASGIPDGPADDTALLLAFDLNQSEGPSPAVGDYLVKVDALGGIRTSNGSGSAWLEDSAADAVEGRLHVSGGFWSVELRIPDGKLGGWNGQDVGGAVFFDRGSSSLANSAWPVQAASANPSTWTTFVFGTDPDDPTDANGNGLPDAWEQQTYGQAGYDPVKNADTDKDGQPDTQEFVAGTNPLSGASRFKAAIDPGFMLSWNVAADRSYTILSSTDLSAWEPVADGLTGGTWQIPVVPGQARCFYRVLATYAR